MLKSEIYNGSGASTAS